VALSPDGSTLYVASPASGEPAEALSTADGSLTASFAPSTGLGAASALALSPDGTRLYATGGTPGFGGWVVALNTSDGSIATGWPSMTGAPAAPQNGVPLNDLGDALALDAAGGKLYVSGNFSQVNSTAQGAVAALSTATGALVPGFNPNPGMPSSSGTLNVRALALSPDLKTLYVAGLFSGIGGSAVPQNLGAVSTATGGALPFAPQPTGAVNAVAATPDGSTVYAGGPFASLNGSAPSYLAEFDPSGNVSTAFAPGIDDYVSALLPSADSKQLIAGGFFRGTLGAPQQGVAVFNLGPPLPPEMPPPPPPTPVITLTTSGTAQLVRIGRHVLLASGKTATCKATTACTVTITLTARVTTTSKHKRHGKTHKRVTTVTVLQQTIPVAAGQSLGLTLTLTPALVSTLTSPSTSHVLESVQGMVTGGTTVSASSAVSTKLPGHKRKHHHKHKKR
jgi:hypothetical protein